VADAFTMHTVVMPHEYDEKTVAFTRMPLLFAAPPAYSVEFVAPSLRPTEEEEAREERENKPSAPEPPLRSKRVVPATRRRSADTGARGSTDDEEEREML
jgi:hypothetical protein